MNTSTVTHVKNIFSQTFYLLTGLISFGSIIIIHELGHLFACKMLGVAVHFFVIGFGPVIAQLHIGNTIFDMCIIPIGGLASIDVVELATQSYASQIAIFLAGSAMNFLGALCIYYYQGKTMQEYRNALYNSNPYTILHSLYTHLKTHTVTQTITNSLTFGIESFVSTFAILNILIGCIKLLPLPFSDGLKIIRATVEQLNKDLSISDYYVVVISLALLATLFAITYYRDIKRWLRV